MAGKKTDSSLLASRYAVALTDKAEEDGISGEIEADMEKLSRMLGEVDGFRDFIGNPLIDRRRKIQAMLDLSGGAGLNKLTGNFLGVLATNRRLSWLEEILTAFAEESSRRRGEVQAEVESATALDKKQIDMITKELSKELGSKVALKVRVNPGLIGGLRIIVGSRMIDNTVSRKLERLQRTLGGRLDKQLEEVA